MKPESITETDSKVRRMDVFVSATGSDLKSFRARAKTALLDIGAHPIEQEHFSLTPGSIEGMLRKKISECDAVVHIVGECFGHEPRDRAPDAPRRSYTQIEYDLARENKKPVYLFTCAPGFPYDEHAPEPEELQHLQQAHRAAVRSGAQHYAVIHNGIDLAMEITKLQAVLGDVAVKLHEARKEKNVLSGEIGAQVVKANRGVIWSLAGLGVVILGLVALFFFTRETARRQRTDLAAIFREELRELLIQNPDADLPLILVTAKEGAAASAKMSLGDYESALAETLKSAGDSAAGLIERATAAFSAGDFAAAAGDAERAAAMGGGEERSARLLAGYALRGLKKFEESARSFGRALELTPALQNDDRIEAQWNVARSLHINGRYRDAAGLWQDLLPMLEKLRGPDHPEVLSARTHLGNALGSIGDLSGAEKVYRAVAEKSKAVLPESDPLIATRILNLAIVLLDQDRPQEAEPLVREALRREQEIHGMDAPQCASTWSVLGSTLVASGRYAEAEAALRKALVIAEKRTPRHEGEIGTIRNNLGSALWKQGRTIEAEAECALALEAKRKLYGGNQHPDVAKLLHNLGRLHFEMLRLDAAEREVREAVSVGRRFIGDDHRDVIAWRRTLASILDAQRKHSEARGILDEILVHLKAQPKRDEIEIASVIGDVGASWLREGRVAEAARSIEESLKLMADAGRPAGPLSPVLGNLADVREKQARRDEAEKLLREILEARERQSGLRHTDTAFARQALADFLFRQGQPDEAERMLREVLVVFQDNLGTTHFKTAECARNLAYLCAKRGAAAEARKLFERALSGFEATFGADSPEVQKVRADLKDLEGR